MSDTYIYARFSPRPNADDCKSIEVQVDACQRYCTMHGWSVTDVYVDREVSARKTRFRDRESGGALFNLLKPEDRVICARLDRAFRNTVDGLSTFAAFEKKEVSIHFSAQEGCSLTTATAQGKLLLSMMLAVTEYEPMVSSERTKAAFKHLKAGMINTFATGKEPFGYEPDFSQGTRENSKASKLLKFCEPEREIVKKILIKRSQGIRCHTISKELNQAGIQCRGKSWTNTKVTRVIRLWKIADLTGELSVNG